MSLRNEETTGIKALMVLEIIGKPAEYLTEALETLVKRIDDENGVSVVDKKINTPVLMKDQETGEDNKKGFYTSFVEVEVEVEEILYLAILMFKYMPAHIEIIEPELIVLTNSGWNDILNELTRRLHGYEEVTRIVNMERKILEQKLKSVLEERKNSKQGKGKRET